MFSSSSQQGQDPQGYDAGEQDPMNTKLPAGRPSVSVEHPLIVHSPHPEANEIFDSSTLSAVLGTPQYYESAILVTIRDLQTEETIDTSWGPSIARPEHDVVAKPWRVNEEGDVVPSGKEYPLKKSELTKRIDSGHNTDSNERLLRKVGQTAFFRVPEDLHDAIHIYSPEHTAGDPPQIPGPGDIIAFTDAGPWVMQWKEGELKEVSQERQERVDPEHAKMKLLTTEVNPGTQQEPARKSIRRKLIEREIDYALKGAQKEAFGWCLKHPIRGISAIISMMRSGEVSEETAKAWQKLPSWNDYQNAYTRLEFLEQDEGYPATHAYAASLDAVKDQLPEQALKRGYYVCAGTDLYWARLFEHTVFEDVGYGQDYVKNMWWRPERYATASLENTVERLQEQQVLSDTVSMDYLTGNSHESRADNDFNTADTTLIIKGGHSVVPFLNDRFSEAPLQFAAIVTVSPHESQEDLLKAMDERGYSCSYYDSGETLYAPYAMGLSRTSIFVPKK